jgi:O-antigen/teichoic acid export membrane protein
MLGLSSVADPFIRLVLTDKWEEAIYLLQIICFALMWYPIHAINLNILQVKGRSDYFLKLEVIKKVQAVIILCVTVPMGIVVMCYGQVVSSLISLIWNTYYTKRLIGYGYWAQMKDLMPIFIHSFVMWVLVLLVVHFMPTLWLKLIVGVLSGMVYYIAGAFLMKFPEVDEILRILKLKR